MREVWLTLLGICWLSAEALAASSFVVGWHGDEEPQWPPEKPSSLYHLVSRPLVSLAEPYQCELCAELPPPPVAGEDPWTIELQLLAQWGDGVTLNAEDIRLGWLWAKRHAPSDTETNLLRRIIGIETAGRHAVRLTFIGPGEMAYRALSLVHPIRSLRVSEGPLPLARRNTARDLDVQADAMRREPADPKWYSGPFRLVEVPAPKRFVLQDALGRKLEIRTYRNADSLLARIKEGQIDVVPADGMPREILSSLPKGATVVGPSTRFEHLDLNTRNPLLVDRRVRIALGMSLDRESLAKGLGQLHHTPWLTSEPTAWLPYDRERAATVLHEAGWQRDTNGRLVRDEAALALTLSHPANDPERARLASAIAEMWRALGIQVDIVTVATEPFFQSHLRKVLFRGAALYAWELQPHAVPMSAFHSDETPIAQNDYTGQNISGWQNRKVDEILTEWAKSPAGEDSTFQAEFQKAYIEDVPQIPLFLWQRSAYVNQRMSGVSFPSVHEPVTRSVNQWSKSTAEKGVALP